MLLMPMKALVNRITRICSRTFCISGIRPERVSGSKSRQSPGSIWSQAAGPGESHRPSLFRTFLVAGVHGFEQWAPSPPELNSRCMLVPLSAEKWLYLWVCECRVALTFLAAELFSSIPAERHLVLSGNHIP